MDIASRANALPRKLGLVDGAALLIGAVIGSGIFVVPSLIARKIPEPGLVMAIWLFSGLLVLCGALALAELGAMLPESGGLYVYMREAYGSFFAFLYGWTNMLVVIPGAVAALTTAFLMYLEHFVPIAPAAEKGVGMAILGGLAYVNVRGVRWGANVQNGFTFLKVASLLGLVALVAVTGRGSAGHFLPLWPTSFSAELLTGVGVAMISTLFAYDGWHFVGYVAGEIRNPERNVPPSIFLGIFVVIAIYAAANLAYLFAIGQAGIAASNRVAADAASAMMGPVGGTLITLAILCSIFGAISANVLAAPRVFFAMARDGLFFRRIAEIHPRHATPANAIWLLSLWAGLLTLTGGFEHLITMAMFANWILFAMVAASVMVLRSRRPDWPRPYRVPAYPLPVVVFVLVAVAFVLNTLVEAPRSSLLGLGIVAAGVLFYVRIRRK